MIHRAVDISSWLIIVNIILRSTVSRPVCPGISPPYGNHDQFFSHFHGNYFHIFFVFLLWGAVTEESCNLLVQLLLNIDSAATLRFMLKSWHLTVSFETKFPFCRLLRLTGLRWSYSSPPSHRVSWLIKSSKVKVIQRPAVSRSVCPGIRPPSGNCGNWFLWKLFLHLRLFQYGVPSLTRGRVCNLFFIADLHQRSLSWVCDSRFPWPHITI
jgi:hypothetical protein